MSSSGPDMGSSGPDMDSSEPKFFRWAVDGPVATITFNRPAKRNGLDSAVMTELERLVCEARDDRSIKVLIATGAGPAFCAGADFTMVRDAPDDQARATAQAEIDQIPRLIGRVIDTLIHADLITIAAVNGHAVGGGWSLAAGFDQIIAADEAEFWLPEVELGLPFRGLVNVALTKRLGPALAMEALVLGRRFTATELQAFRLVNAVCSLDQLADATASLAQRYLAMPWKAAMATRRDINATIYGPQYY